ncbi:uncharacterized protein LOC101862793 isoform X2 [Aplysia californica]|uniref:Uncharacterized protein LOC101862793 isoform X2 n=1 Tax=Aplysia californica TaxID=6500 RepID=A0ABM0JMV0_APLCA|nr:uncharacterized protein LOC101862793 isoform X2 [Aplysia californica]
MAAPPERAGVVRDEATGAMRMLPGEQMKTEIYWDRALEESTGPHMHMGQTMHHDNRGGMRQMHTLTNVRSNPMPDEYVDDRDSTFDSYAMDKDRMKFSSLTKFFLHRAEKSQARPNHEQQEQLYMEPPSMPVSSEMREEFVPPNLEQLRDVTPAPTISAPSPPKKGRGRPRKPDSMKRKSQGDGPVRKKATPLSAPTPIDCPERVAEIMALEKVDAVTLALEMGYTNPYEKIGGGGGDKDGKDKDSEHDDEEGSKKISPVENIQQVLDYRKSSGCACLSALTLQDVAAHRLEIASLDRQSRDFFIMGLFRGAAVPTTITTRNSDRQRYRFNYRLLNTRICQVCFLFVNNIGAKYMKNLKKHFNEMGVRSRTHGNQGRKPHHALRSDDVENVADFIIKYGTIHGAPGKAPKGKTKKTKAKGVIRLPAAHTFTSVYKEYKELCEHTGKRGIAASTFRKIWSSHAPHIKVVQHSTNKESPPTPKWHSKKAAAAAAVTASTSSTAASTSASDSNITTNTATIATTESTGTDDPSLKTQEEEEIVKRMMKSQMKDLEDGTAAEPSPPAPAVEEVPSVPVSLPFDFGSVDMPQTPMMPLSMYLTESPGNADTSWQQNMMLPQGPGSQQVQPDVQQQPQPQMGDNRNNPVPQHELQNVTATLPPTHQLGPPDMQGAAGDPSSLPKYDMSSQAYQQPQPGLHHW